MRDESSKMDRYVYLRRVGALTHSRSFTILVCNHLVALLLHASRRFLSVECTHVRKSQGSRRGPPKQDIVAYSLDHSATSEWRKIANRS